MTKANTIKYLRTLAKKRGVSVVFRKFVQDYDGLCESSGKKIQVNKNMSKRDIATTFFHELSHAHCIKNGLYKKFHKLESTNPLEIFAAENKVEHIARCLWNDQGMSKLFGQYRFYYRKKDMKSVLNWIKKDLAQTNRL